MPTLTKAQQAKHRALRVALDVARSAIYAAAPDRNTPFSDCYAVATPAARLAHEAALGALSNFEQDMIDERRAWRASYGAFTPYFEEARGRWRVKL